MDNCVCWYCVFYAKNGYKKKNNKKSPQAIQYYPQGQMIKSFQNMQKETKSKLWKKISLQLQNRLLRGTLIINCARKYVCVCVQELMLPVAP